MHIEHAMELLGVDENLLQPFDVTDPFNDNIRLEGFICQKPDYRYGALVILKVDNRPAPQRIFATPKLHYPFDKNGNFHFPSIKTAHIYEKLDGTNVLAYRYQGADNLWRLTYKLRLSPVLRNSKWGPFLDYWNELLIEHPEIALLVAANNCHVSFEMYGARNTHLIAYENPLAAAVLFGISPINAEIIAPFQFQATAGLLSAPLLCELRTGENPVKKFQSLREEMERQNKPVLGGKLSGTEGVVWYVTEPSGKVSMWKCKPESVEDIHWATGINKAAVIATCWNVFETSDALNYETLLPLLLEEYSLADIEKFRVNIDIAISQVNAEQEFRQKVKLAYERIKSQGLSISQDKGAVMRILSEQFRREQMSHVYATIVGLE